jgi:uncharacterized cupin superfamily protein
MSEMRPAAIVAREVPARNNTIYPPSYAAALVGREKRMLGDAFGLTQFGVNLTTLRPGAWSSQRHWHEREDEFIYVVDGEIVLIDDAGEHILTPGMCAGFKAGVSNGHHLVNKSARPATYVEIGTRSPEERSHYPEADMQGVKKGGKWTITRKDGSAY